MDTLLFPGRVAVRKAAPIRAHCKGNNRLPTHRWVFRGSDETTPISHMLQRSWNGRTVVLWFLISLVMVTMASTVVNAQSLMNGSWRCANDKADSVRMSPPTEEGRIALCRKSFAKGSAEAILAKGGPSGLFLWAYLHGIHSDRISETQYKMVVFVRDHNGYHYAVTPPLTTKVAGVLDKPERNRHCFGQFALTPGSDDAEFLRSSVEADVPLEVTIAALRNRNDWEWIVGELLEFREEIISYFTGELTAGELLEKLNEGKAPRGHSKT